MERGDSRKVLEERRGNVSSRIHGVARELRDLSSVGVVPQDHAKAISDNLSTLNLALLESKAGIQEAHKLAHVEMVHGQPPVPLSYALASAYWQLVQLQFGERSLVEFVIAVQERVALTMNEIWNLKPFLELALLEAISGAIPPPPLSDRKQPGLPKSGADLSSSRLSRLLRSLQELCDLDWKKFFEEASATEKTLRTDPTGTYENMDWESRDAYRAAVTEIAAGSAFTESQVAQKAIALARKAHRPDSSARNERPAHVGYYLVDAGRRSLKTQVGYRSSVARGLREAIFRRSDFFYLIGIEVITLGLIALLMTLLHVKNYGFLVLTLFLIPSAGCAVTLMNLLVTRLFPPRRLPKLDFSKGIPNDSATVVVVPVLLTSEAQVRLAVQALETRFLANRDPNLHFALLTDPPDSTQQFDEKDALAGLCSKLIHQLNEKYSPQKNGTLFHFHRHRTFNAAEGLWMGWERKRGKLLEFNRFLLNQSDGFPLKTGDLSKLSNNIRYVITLDLDTQLPPGSAHRLVGAIAHPLNKAVIDPARNVVVEGYGILQPRVDISIQSVNSSRFARLLSGDTGFDMYTRAVSDVYQDLFGEGIFTGKGIYDVRTFQQVLDDRLPCNAVLSHDLIEGLYARTGLVSDIEVVDDYPSHVSAFSRRRHRWVRGDWQIIFGLLPRVRDSFDRILRNPLSHMSRWKILDNLRRSLMECATLLFLLYGWFARPGVAAYWTSAALAILFFPVYFQFVLAVLTAGKAAFTADFWKNAISDFAHTQTRLFLRLVLLLYQALADADAVVRTLARITLTHKKMLEWETSADAESNAGPRNLVDFYLKWTLPISLAIGGLIFIAHPQTIAIAFPFLFLWGSSRWICKWLNGESRKIAGRVKPKDSAELRLMALRTWRFFREFSNAGENWLVPDIVQESPPLKAHRISPTNLGLLLDSRVAALDLGLLTLPEFIQHTEKTFLTIWQMPKYRGHLYNWYTTDTLQPVEPLFVSSVDSGNLLCSIWTLEHGCREAIQQPLVSPALWQGIADHVALLAEVTTRLTADPEILASVQELRRQAIKISPTNPMKYEHLRSFEIDATVFLSKLGKSEGLDEAKWWGAELSQRVSNLRDFLEDLMPWIMNPLTEQGSLAELMDVPIADTLSLASLPRKYREILLNLNVQESGTPLDSRAHAEKVRLNLALERAIRVADDLSQRLTALAASAESMATEMDFSFLYDDKRKLLSIGYEAASDRIAPYYYDLLASEARAAVFCAVAKGEIPVECWLRLKRAFRSYKGQNVLLSWTGTAFEYMMPSLWMRGYRNTILERSARAAIRAQKQFAEENGIPWGISESSCNQRNPDGHYRYHAFGVPGIAVHRDDCSGDHVVAPYATFLALEFDTRRALKNLRRMKKLGWLSAYGFYEAADFTERRVAPGHDHEVVRNWMAHHQGMSLLAIGNILCSSAMQRRFHAEPRVAAFERLLHERYPRVVPRDQDPKAEPASDIALASQAPQIALHSGLRSLSPKLS